MNSYELLIDLRERLTNGAMYVEDGTIEALDAAMDVMCGPVPDHETGLVRCGCGGKAVLHDENKVSCNKCGITTLEQFTQDDARNDWNTAMGWRGK